MKKKNTVTTFLIELAFERTREENGVGERRKTYLYHEEAFIQEVELPSRVINADRVDVLPEEQGEIGGERLDHEPVGADAVRQDLDWVRHVEGDPVHVSSSSHLLI